MIRRLFILLFAVSLSGCRIIIVVPEGGRVVSDSGEIDCGAGQTCVVEVQDLLFDETIGVEVEPGVPLVESPLDASLDMATQGDMTILFEWRDLDELAALPLFPGFLAEALRTPPGSATPRSCKAASPSSPYRGNRSTG